MKSLILVASTISSIVLILLLTRKSHSRLNGATLNPDRVHSTSILGGVTERNVSQDFRGGRLTAFLGGVSVDLRQAEIVEKTRPYPRQRHSLAASKYPCPTTGT